MQPVVVRGFAELRDAGITRTGYELHGLLFLGELHVLINGPFTITSFRGGKVRH